MDVDHDGQVDMGGFSGAQRAQIQQLLMSFRSGDSPRPASSGPPTRIISGDSDSRPPASGTRPQHSINVQQTITPYRSVQLAPTNGSREHSASQQANIVPPHPSQRLPASVPVPSRHILSGVSGAQSSSSFLSFHNMRREVNQQRLAAASVNLAPQRRRSGPRAPPSQTLQPRVSRNAGRAVHGTARPLPRLSSLQAVENCCIFDEHNNIESIKVDVQIYPRPVRVCQMYSSPSIMSSYSIDPQDIGSGDLFVYRFQQENYMKITTRWGLAHSLTLTPDTLISNLINHVHGEMVNGLHQYRFPSPRSFQTSVDDPDLVLQEPLLMCLLGLVNKGLPRPKDGHVRLQSFPCHQLTVRDLMARPKVFAHADHCIVEGSRFIIRLRELHSFIYLIFRVLMFRNSSCSSWTTFRNSSH